MSTRPLPSRYEAKAAADTVGIKVATSEIRQSKDIASAFDALKGHADALYVCTDPVVFTNLVRINILAAAVGYRRCTANTSKRAV